MEMAKARERIAAAIEDVATKIDRGFKVDTDGKTLALELKKIKNEVSDAALAEMNDGELSLRLTGKKASALVSVSESYSLDTTVDDFDLVEKAADAGELDGVVQKRLSASIQPEHIEEIRRLIGQVLFDEAISVSTSYSVEPEGYRSYEPNGSPERSRIKRVLDAAVTCTSTSKVRFGALNGKRKLKGKKANGKSK
jgi:hypothetical protein